MKAILMSIKPKWCEKIFSGEKTVEVRKTAPKLKPPFKVYVYQTKYRLCNKFINEVLNTVYDGCKVIGEFVCDKIDELVCLSYQEVIEYFCKPEELDGKKVKALHGLHIAARQLAIYRGFIDSIVAIIFIKKLLTF